MADLSTIFKAYDVRGPVPDEWDAGVATAIGEAFATLLVDGDDTVEAVVVGHDMRATSPAIARALADGIMRTGLAVVDLGLVATEEVYFASGSLRLPGAMVTASHNPGSYNGLKLCRTGAAPVGRDTGLTVVRDVTALLLDGRRPVADVEPGGRRTSRDISAGYVAHLCRLAPVLGRRLRVVADAGNGMAGRVLPAVLADVDVDLVPLYFELDGSFPNHPADPLDPTTLTTLRRTVEETGADVGLAFDGDADRCFVIDEHGEPVSPSALASLIAVRELDRSPGSTVVHNVVTSRALAETVRAHGGVPFRTPVGHSYVKQAMADHDAVFGGEHSGHFYFREFWYADSGMLAARHVLGAVAASTRPLSQLVASLSPYYASGELNVTTPDAAGVTDLVRDRFTARPGTTTDHLDGLTVSHDAWWLNIRPSNTEPLLRLNVEAVDADIMESVRDEALALMRRPM
jgi:phosphomannomutase